jgi:predicted metalloprotease with PDZ domain
VAEPIRYILRFPAPQSHYVEVEASFPTQGNERVELMMAVWTPGSYLVREFARHVEDLKARGEKVGSLGIEKLRKNRWRVETQGESRITISYRLYCREMSVQTNWVDSSFALLNGASTFLTFPGDAGARPHEVTLELPPGWLKTVTGLPETPDGLPHRYVAADFDTLVDSPLYAGNPALYEFEVDGIPHILLNEGEGGVWDGPRSARDVESIVRVQRDFWGFLPYKKYVFFNILTESGGGLEHKNSTVLMYTRWATRTRPTYLNWLYLVSHEFFHTWNVKRLRPAELGPFDYEAEVHTRSLWIAEGITNYYDRLFVRRAGLCTVSEYLAGPVSSAEGDRPIGDIERLQTIPGRLVQPLESASFDAWIKFYRRDENTINTAISYYTKGAVVGFLLDAEIRRATNGAKSLDDVMRLAYQRFSGDNGFSPADFQKLAQEVAGSPLDLAPWFHKALETTEELDYDTALAWFGLRFAPANEVGGDEGESPSKEDASAKGEGSPGPGRSDRTKPSGKPPKAWLGLETRVDDGRLIVSQVRRDTPAATAGFNVDDEILAINDDRIRASQWSKRMEAYRPNEQVSVLIARRDRLQRLQATFGQEPPRRWVVEIDPGADDAQKAHRRAWLGE